MNYDLKDLLVMHMLEGTPPIEGDGVASSVRLGFRWAEAGEGTGIFICTCKKPCLDPEVCGRMLWEELATPKNGHEVAVKLPWTAKIGDEVEQAVMAVWCCNNCEVVATGSIYDVMVSRFYDLPARLLQYERENSRSYMGLREHLGRCYPDRFSEGSFVTLVLFRRTT